MRGLYSGLEREGEHGLFYTLNRLTAAGFTKDSLHMQGRLDQGNLALTCASKAGSCPDDLMVFHKGK